MADSVDVCETRNVLSKCICKPRVLLLLQALGFIPDGPDRMKHPHAGTLILDDTIIVTEGCPWGALDGGAPIFPSFIHVKGGGADVRITSSKMTSGINGARVLFNFHGLPKEISPYFTHFSMLWSLRSTMDVFGNRSGSAVVTNAFMRSASDGCWYIASQYGRAMFANGQLCGQWVYNTVPPSILTALDSLAV